MQSDRVKVLFETREVLELLLEHVTAEDSGVYKVVAKNSEGETSTSGAIAITSKWMRFPALSVARHFAPGPF